MKLISEPLPVAMGGVAFVAQEAQRPARPCDQGLRKRGQLIEFVLRFRRFQMAFEDAQHLVSMATTRREPPLFRSAELLQMHIADAVLIESGGKLAFRKPRTPRRRHRTHVDQESDPRLRQRIEEGARGRVLVADGEQRFQGPGPAMAGRPAAARPGLR
jgi:hypothetical protein